MPFCRDECLRDRSHREYLCGAIFESDSIGVQFNRNTEKVITNPSSSRLLTSGDFNGPLSGYFNTHFTGIKVYGAHVKELETGGRLRSKVIPFFVPVVGVKVGEPPNMEPGVIIISTYDMKGVSMGRKPNPLSPQLDNDHFYGNVAEYIKKNPKETNKIVKAIRENTERDNILLGRKAPKSQAKAP